VFVLQTFIFACSCQSSGCSAAVLGWAGEEQSKKSPRGAAEQAGAALGASGVEAPSLQKGPRSPMTANISASALLPSSRVEPGFGCCVTPYWRLHIPVALFSGKPWEQMGGSEHLSSFQLHYRAQKPVVPTGSATDWDSPSSGSSIRTALCVCPTQAVGSEAPLAVLLLARDVAKRTIPHNSNPTLTGGKRKTWAGQSCSHRGASAEL